MQGHTPIGKQTGLTVAGTAVSLTVPTGAKPRAATVQVFEASVRFWLDGSVPTATTGHRADIGDLIQLESSAEVVNFKVIRETSTSASVEVTYYG